MPLAGWLLSANKTLPPISTACCAEMGAGKTRQERTRRAGARRNITTTSPGSITPQRNAMDHDPSCGPRSITWRLPENDFFLSVHLLEFLVLKCLLSLNV